MRPFDTVIVEDEAVAVTTLAAGAVTEKAGLNFGGMELDRCDRRAAAARGLFTTTTT